VAWLTVMVLTVIVTRPRHAVGTTSKTVQFW
jgi:hypothetical protein